MAIRVGDLTLELRNRSRVVTAHMGDVELIHEGDSAGTLRVGDIRLPWGDRTTQMLMGFFKGPGYKYLLRQPLSWQAEVVRHHAEAMADNESVWYIEGSNVAGIYHPDAKMIPLSLVAEQIADVFDPDAMASVLYSPDQVEINVTSFSRTVTVPGISGFAGRPGEGEVEHPYTKMKVGDLSAGGVRIIIHPGKPERAPVVQEFWERLACTNGMTRTISGSTINLRGRTVEEILQEMNKIMRVIWEGLEESGRLILHSAQALIPGATSDFIRQVARERGINAATILRLQERAMSLPANPTAYDVAQVMTALANEEGVAVLTRRNLQMAGGDLTIDADRMVHRCGQCERPLAA